MLSFTSLAHLVNACCDSRAAVHNCYEKLYVGCLLVAEVPCKVLKVKVPSSDQPEIIRSSVSVSVGNGSYGVDAALSDLLQFACPGPGYPEGVLASSPEGSVEGHPEIALRCSLASCVCCYLRRLDQWRLSLATSMDTGEARVQMRA